MKLNRRYHLHLGGLIYIALAVLVGIAAANRPNNLLVWIFGIMLAAVLVSGLLSGLMMLGVRVQRLDPRLGRVGDPLMVRYALHNRSRFIPIFNVHIVERPGTGADQAKDWSASMAPAEAWILHAGPGETVHGEAVYWPTRRGILRMDGIRVWSTFPFGLFKKSVDISQVQETLVCPRVHTLRAGLLRSLMPAGVAGMRGSRRTGQGEDYYGSREYRPGDSVRQVAWKQFARHGTLVSIERTQPSPPRLRIVLNLLRPTDQLRVDPADGLSPREVEEQAISLAASLLAHADIEGYEVGLTVLGLDVPPTPLRRGFRHVQRLLALMATLDLDGERSRRDIASFADAERSGIVIISPDRADPSLGAASTGSAWHLTARQLGELMLPGDHAGGESAVAPRQAVPA